MAKKGRYATPDDPHCDTCCPWYPSPCGAFSGEFSTEFADICRHTPCVELQHPVGSLTDHAAEYPWECLPWRADFSCCDDWDQLDPDLQKRATTLAWNTMRGLTAGRVASTCTILRPCFRDYPCELCQAPGELGMNPMLVNGVWKNWPECRPLDCSCCDVCEIVMPGTVAALLEVNIDGYRHDPRLFRIDNGNRLVRQDGCCFPSCQNMNAPYGYYGAFGVRYVPGIVPDASGLWAVGLLACEFSKACRGDKCRLPRAVTSLSRQGVSFEFPRRMWENGTTIEEVDAYVHSVNPNGLRVAPKVWSPDMMSQKHRITTGGPTGVWP